MTWVNCKHFISEGLGGTCSHGAAPLKVLFFKSLPADCIMAYGPSGKDPRVARCCNMQEKLDSMQWAGRIPPMPPIPVAAPVFSWLLIGGEGHGLVITREHNDSDRIRVEAVRPNGEDEYFRTVYMFGAAFYRIAICSPTQQQFDEIPRLITDRRLRPI